MFWRQRISLISRFNSLLGQDIDVKVPEGVAGYCICSSQFLSDPREAFCCRQVDKYRRVADDAGVMKTRRFEHRCLNWEVSLIGARMSCQSSAQDFAISMYANFGPVRNRVL